MAGVAGEEEGGEEEGAELGLEEGVRTRWVGDIVEREVWRRCV